MSTLFTFGCSYTEDYDDRHQNYRLYKEFRGGTFPKNWTTLLSEKLEVNLKNYGLSAAGNQLIFSTFCKHVNEINKGDIVIVQWSFIERYRLSDKLGVEWLRIGPGPISKDNPVSKECHESILFNRTNDCSKKLYVDEIYDYEKIIDRLSKEVGFEVYYWTIINELIYNQPKNILNQKKYLLNDYVKDEYDNTFTIILKNGGKWIFEETNNMVKDGHMGELGHQVQSDLFYKHIMKHQ
jgi:hypothetical protein